MSPSAALTPGSRFVIPAPAALETAMQALTEARRDGAGLDLLRLRATAAGHAWIEAVLDGFILAMARALRGGPSGQRTAALVRGAGDRVIDGAVRRARAEQIAALDTYLASHVGPGAEGAVIGYPVSARLAATLAPALAAAGSGRAGEHVAEIAAAMHATADETLRELLDVPLGLLELGAVLRATVAIGRSAALGRAHGDIDRALARSTEAAGRVAEFLARGVVAAPPTPAAAAGG